MLVSIHAALGSITGDITWHSWWTKWKCNRLFPNFHHCSLLIIITQSRLLLSTLKGSITLT